MAKRADRNRAILLRKQGKSYSQIKSALGISKSTLSGWLKDYPLSSKRLRTLRDFNEKRIEHFRETMAKKRRVRMHEVYKTVSREIGKLQKRELLLVGLYLYWAEGAKSSKYTVSLSNTDPAMIRFFIYWMEKVLHVDRSKVYVRLHLYTDMDQEKEEQYWREALALPKSAFKPSYIKKSKYVDITYKTGFGHGTCNVYVFGRDVWEYVTMSLQYMRNTYR